MAARQQDPVAMRGLLDVDEEELGPRPGSTAARRRAPAAAGPAAALLALAALAALLRGRGGAAGRLRRAELAGVQGLDDAKPAPVATLPFTMQTCTKSGCTAQSLGLTMDANWRWYNDGTKTCGKCKTAEDCSKCKHQEKIDYAGAYGVTVSSDGTSVTLTKSARTYVLDANGKDYFMLNLLGKELTFDVNMSELSCGDNSALYTVEMAKDGGYDGGAQIGTGYCDAQCPRGMRTIGGKPDLNNTPQCCNEMDLWEANRRATVLTAHPCVLPGGKQVVGNYVCEGMDCESGDPDGAGMCAGLGCDLNPYRDGLTDFYDEDGDVTTKSIITVTTQFVADDGELKEIRRSYKQGNKTFEMPSLSFGNVVLKASLSDQYCEAEAANFSGKEYDLGAAPATSFVKKHGGVANMGKSLARGNVLVLSLWNDKTGHMLWLDGKLGNSSLPGSRRGPCGHSDHSDGLKNASVTFSNIRFGDIGTTTPAEAGKGGKGTHKAAAAPSKSLAGVLLPAAVAVAFACHERH